MNLKTYAKTHSFFLNGIVCVRVCVLCTVAQRAPQQQAKSALIKLFRQCKQAEFDSIDLNNIVSNNQLLLTPNNNSNNNNNTNNFETKLQTPKVSVLKSPNRQFDNLATLYESPKQMQSMQTNDPNSQKHES